MATQTAGQDEFPPGEGRPQRELAHRLFAAEFNRSTHEFKEGGERSPSYLVTPFGARVNRLLVVGVLTHVEQVGSTGDMWKAQIMDPTGVFNVYAGQYQPEAASALSEIKPPAVVAVVGKTRVYSPEEGVTYTSIRPEKITTVDVAERDRWILDAARQSMKRLDAMREAGKLEVATVDSVRDLGYPEDVADGVARAIGHYGSPNLEEFASVIRDALEFVVPGTAPREAPDFQTPSFTPASESPAAAAPTPATAEPKAAPAPAPAASKDEAAEAREEVIRGLVDRLDDGKGAPWEDIVAAAAKEKVTEEQVEEALNNLMDRGLIYEPVLGRLKKT